MPDALKKMEGLARQKETGVTTQVLLFSGFPCNICANLEKKIRLDSFIRAGISEDHVQLQLVSCAS